MLFLFNWKRKASQAIEEDESIIGNAAGSLNIKKKRRRLSAFKPVRPLEWPMYETDDEEELLLMLGVI